MTTSISELTQQARSLASTLSYNDEGNEATIKHVLREMAHRLDSVDIRFIKHPVTKRTLVRNGIGASRRASLIERVLFKLFGILPTSV